MKIKEVLTDSLKKAVDKMIDVTTASVQWYGVEEMPQSMTVRR